MLSFIKNNIGHLFFKVRRLLEKISTRSARKIVEKTYKICDI
jgi:hypothetical protein